MPRRTPKPPGASARRCARRASKCGSTRASCAGVTPGMRRSAGRSRSARCSCRSSRPTRRRGRRATSGWNGNSRSIARMMADDKAFLLPVVIDDTRCPRACRKNFARCSGRTCRWGRRQRPLPASRRSGYCRAGAPSAMPVAPPRVVPGAAPVLAAAAAASKAPAAQLATAAAAETPSVAVLPFVNMSRDEENEYFADGLVGGAAERAGEDPRPARGVADVGVLVQGQGDRHPDHRRRSSTSATVLEGSVRQLRQARARSPCS